MYRSKKSFFIYPVKEIMRSIEFSGFLFLGLFCFSLRCPNLECFRETGFWIGSRSETKKTLRLHLGPARIYHIEALYCKGSTGAAAFLLDRKSKENKKKKEHNPASVNPS
jgi:hypothetical protein